MGSRLRRCGQMCERGARSVASSDRWCTRCVNVNGFLSRLHLTKSIIMNGMNTICGAAINSRRESDQNLRGRFIQENVSVHFNGYRISRRRQPRSLKAKNKNWDTSAGAPRLFPDSIISYVPPESLFYTSEQVPEIDRVPALPPQRAPYYFTEVQLANAPFISTSVLFICSLLNVAA